MLMSFSSSLVIAADRPNVVWIMSEDNSKHYLKHFDRHGAETPNIEALAQHGVTFDRAFSCAPVCSVARTTLITSCYGPRIGTQFHRRLAMAPMPDGLKMFPAYLRDAGYYTTNNSKQDYNAQKRSVWDDSSKRATWKNRPDSSTPFFHVVTSTLSHEGKLHFNATQMNQPTVTEQQAVQLQPYFPDTKTFRFTRARYHDLMMEIDRVVGETVAELKEAGELENTFVFYFGDHGGVLPRSKGYAYESGLHVPFVVRVPENFKELTGRDLASRTNGFVEFVDFGPTVLALAGIEPPLGIDGRAFLGKNTSAEEVDLRQEAFGYADRIDEKYDLVRTLRQGDFKYMRNFEPFLPDGLQNNYRYQMLAFVEWRELHAQGKLNEFQSQFFEPKAVEALYDLKRDPHEIHNLAADPKYKDQLVKMRDRLTQRLKEMPDLSFIPEALLVDEPMKNPVQFGQQNQDSIAQLIDTANLALLPYAVAKPMLETALSSDDPLVRYWGVVACSSFGKEAADLLPLVEKRLVDLEPLVVMRAVEFVSIASEKDTRNYLYRSFQRATSEPEALRMMNTTVFLNDFFGDRLSIDMSKVQFLFDVDQKNQIQRRLDYLAR